MLSATDIGNSCALAANHRRFLHRPESRQLIILLLRDGIKPDAAFQHFLDDEAHVLRRHGRAAAEHHSNIKTSKDVGSM